MKMEFEDITRKWILKQLPNSFMIFIDFYETNHMNSSSKIWILMIKKDEIFEIIF
jgi:hypothetical protein